MLPILQSSSDDLLRYYRRAKLQWARHIAEETQLDFGIVFFNPQLPLRDANRVYDAFVPPAMKVSDILTEADQFFAARNLRCTQWTLSASADPASGKELVDAILSRGYRADLYDVMRLSALPGVLPPARDDLQILPARASFRHARQIAEESAQRVGAPALADASMLHLDDPQWDALLALKDGAVVGRIGVLSVGEIGLIENVFVSAPFRQQRVATTMLHRAIEICQRSLFRHVLLGVSSDNASAISLYKKFGFAKVADAPTYILSD
ncbi:MAG TPA: GNAT family N-acetyltransferase [Tepidisphaeraceae bacterium]|jgi:GNAT superfamily N-acetyltransferase